MSATQKHFLTQRRIERKGKAEEFFDRINRTKRLIKAKGGKKWL